LIEQLARMGKSSYIQVTGSLSLSIFFVRVVLFESKTVLSRPHCTYFFIHYNLIKIKSYDKFDLFQDIKILKKKK